MMTKMIQRMVGRTNALTKVMTMEMNRMMVATIRVPLNIVWSCFLKPLRTTKSVSRDRERSRGKDGHEEACPKEREDRADREESC